MALEKLHLVVFVQDDATKEVLQAAAIPVSGKLEYSAQVKPSKDKPASSDQPQKKEGPSFPKSKAEEKQKKETEVKDKAKQTEPPKKEAEKANLGK